MTGDSLAMEEPVKNVETQPRPHDKTIKVLATKAFVTSILTKSAEELESVIRDWTGASFSFAERSAIRSFGKFAADIKGLAIPSDKTVSHSVALRHILSSSAIIPVISLDQTEIQDGHAVGVRILRRKKVKLVRKGFIPRSGRSNFRQRLVDRAGRVWCDIRVHNNGRQKSRR